MCFKDVRLQGWFRKDFLLMNCQFRPLSDPSIGSGQLLASSLCPCSVDCAHPERSLVSQNMPEPYKTSSKSSIQFLIQLCFMLAISPPKKLILPSVRSLDVQGSSSARCLPVPHFSKAPLLDAADPIRHGSVVAARSAPKSPVSASFAFGLRRSSHTSAVWVL